MSVGRDGPPPRCELCGRDDQDVEAFGLTICHACEVGDFDEHLERALGAHVIVRRRHLADADGVTLGRSTLDVQLRYRDGPDLEASFVAERGAHALIKLFFSELQVGDARFDDCVYIRESDRAAMAELLGSTGLQQAICFGVQHGGTISMERDLVSAKTAGIDDELVGSFILVAAVVAHHAHAYARR